MALFNTATQQSNKTPSAAPLLESGSYPARVVRIIDMGMQPGSAQYPKPTLKMMVTFELLEEYMKEVDANGNPVMVQDPDEDEGVMMMKDILDKPRFFDFEFTYNSDGFMGDGSHIYKFMRAIDALAVPANLEQGIQGHPAIPLNECLGLPLNIGLIQKTQTGGKKAGQVVNKVATFAPMKSKEKKAARELINETMFFDMGNPDLEVFNKLPGGDSEWALRNRITSGIDFNKSKLYELLGGAPQRNETPNQASDEQIDEAMRAELAAQEAAKKAREAEGGAAADDDEPF